MAIRETSGWVQRNLFDEGHRPQDDLGVSEVRQGGDGSTTSDDKFGCIRVFPRKTKWTPQDSLVFIGDPPLFLPPKLPVKISCTFTWDIEEALRLKKSWARFYPDVSVGGPAFNDPGNEFEPGIFVISGVTFTSRGCPFSCPWCLVPAREGNIRELPIRPGNIVQDNNLLACSDTHINQVFDMLEKQKQVVFKGLSTTLLKKWHINRIYDLSLKEMWFAADTADSLMALERVANYLHTFSINKKRCYVLIGFDNESPDQAEQRCEKVYDLGFLPFAQLFRPVDSNLPKHHSKIWRDLARKWCRPAAYRTASEP